MCTLRFCLHLMSKLGDVNIIANREDESSTLGILDQLSPAKVYDRKGNDFEVNRVSCGSSACCRVRSGGLQYS